MCSKLIFEHSWLLTLMEEAGSISPVLMNQLEVFKAQNAFKEKENRVTYLPFFPQRSNRGCSQGCSRTQASLTLSHILATFVAIKKSNFQIGISNLKYDIYNRG